MVRSQNLPANLRDAVATAVRIAAALCLSLGWTACDRGQAPQRTDCPGQVRAGTCVASTIPKVDVPDAGTDASGDVEPDAGGRQDAGVNDAD